MNLPKDAIHPVAALTAVTIGQRIQQLELRQIELHTESDEPSMDKIQVGNDLLMAQFMLSLVLDYLHERDALDTIFVID